MPRSPRPRMSRRTWLRSALAGAGTTALAACGIRLPRGGPRGDVTAVPTTGPLALVGGFLVVEGQRMPGTVVLDGDRIAAAGQDVAVPDGVRQLDVAALTLLPGFVDAHVHVQFSTAAAILGGGVTTVRDLGSPPDAALALRGTTPLRVLAAGRILTPPRGYPAESWGADGTAREVADADDGRAAVAEQVAAGATVVKVALENSAGRPLFGQDVLAAIVDAAHDAGLAVTTHVGTAEGLALALETGIDELCHLPLYAVSVAEMIRAAEAGMVLCPTLAIRGRDPDAARAVAAFREAGGTVVYGTDLGNGGTSPGIMAGEVVALLDTGMTPVEVLAAATAGAADHLGLADVGRLQEGAAADLIAVDGDPLADPAAYEALRLVVAAGAIVRDDLGP